MKKIVMILGVVILIAAIAGISFWGGMTYQSHQAEQVRNTFMAERGMPGGNSRSADMPGGMPGNESQFPARGIGFGGGGMFGQVKSLDGNELLVSSAQEVTTVKLSPDTVIIKSVEGNPDDLAAGSRITVVGQTDKDGVITASQINILRNDFPLPGAASPAETEP